MQEMNVTSSNTLFSAAAIGVATRSIAGAVDVTLDANAAAAEALALTGNVTAPINVNLPRTAGMMPLDSTSAGASLQVGYGKIMIVRMAGVTDNANQIALRGVDLTTSPPTYGTPLNLPLTAGAVPNAKVYTLDGLTFYRMGVYAA